MRPPRPGAHPIGGPRRCADASQVSLQNRSRQGPARGEPVTGTVAGRTLDDVLDRMTSILEAMPPELAPRRAFLATYQRTTRAVGEALAYGAFEDPAWVEAWDVAFADLYLDALDA